jgi:hypothetical protein
MVCLLSTDKEQVWVDGSRTVYLTLVKGSFVVTSPLYAKGKSVKVMQAVNACRDYCKAICAVSGKTPSILPILRESGFRKVMSIHLTPPE